MLQENTLFKFWERIKTATQEGSDETRVIEWNEQVHQLSHLGIGMEEALRYLYSSKPSFEIFLNWVTERSNPGEGEEFKGRVFTDEELHFWEINGYIVLKDAIPAKQCEDARNAIWELLEANESEPDSWYQKNDAKNGLMLNFFNHPALDTNRRSGKIRKAYQELYRDEQIYLLVDKVSFNPPETNSYKFMGSSLHWDVSLQLPIPFELQGLLYLNDVDADGGAFYCVPGFHKKIEEWLSSVPENVNPRDFALRDLQPIPVTGRAGDLVIWHQALPHCATPNKGNVPRMVQYIAYKPLKTHTAAVWK